jgi:hypothetical protein
MDQETPCVSLAIVQIKTGLQCNSDLLESWQVIFFDFVLNK